MRLVVAREGGRFRAWVQDDAPVNAQRVELECVDTIIGYDLATCQKLGYPTDVYVRFAYGSVTFPRDRVTIKGDGLPLLDDGNTVEGA